MRQWGLVKIVDILLLFVVIHDYVECSFATLNMSKPKTSWSKDEIRCHSNDFSERSVRKKEGTRKHSTHTCAVYKACTLASASCAQKLSFNPRFNGYPLNLSRRSITIDFLWIWFFFDQLKHRTFCGLLNLAPVGKEFHHTSVSIFAGASYA